MSYEEMENSLYCLDLELLQITLTLKLSENYVSSIVHSIIRNSNTIVIFNIFILILLVILLLYS